MEEAMMHGSFRNSLGVLSAVALFVLSATANAGAIGGKWDPPFFTGIAEFFVPDPPSPCLSGSGAENVNGANPCTGVVLLSVSADRGDGAGNTGHLSFDGPPDTANINQIFLQPSAHPPVQGINMSAPFELNCEDVSGDFCDDLAWFFQFTFTSDFPSVSNSVRLFSCSDVDFETGGCDDEGGFKTEATSRDVTFTPEPGTLALIIGALGAAWGARRRKRRA
jgi:hypothetical protein